MSEIFNQIANHYDTPERKALAKIIQDELISQLPSSTKELTFMDYGGGTGLVSLALADRFKQLLLVDSSDAMLTIAEDKIKTSGLTNVSSATFDATTESIDQKIDQKVDLILMSLVLLHIPDTRLILEKLYHMLTPNGQLLITMMRSTIQKSIMGLTMKHLWLYLNKLGFIPRISTLFTLVKIYS